MIINNELDNVVWINPSRGRYAVYVGNLQVTGYISMGVAEAIVKNIKLEMVRAAKEEIVKLAINGCEHCRKKEPFKKVKTEFGIRLLHKVGTIGYQDCESEPLWREMMIDTLERTEDENKGQAAQRFWLSNNSVFNSTITK